MCVRDVRDVVRDVRDVTDVVRAVAIAVTYNTRHYDYIAPK